MTLRTQSFNILDIIKCNYSHQGSYWILEANPATGILYVTENSTDFISGHIRLRGKNDGQYPFNYVQMIDHVFGPDEHTIEVCSRHVKGCFTVDINPDTDPVMVDDAQVLSRLPDNQFTRYRSDPPYSEATSTSMYGTSLPNTGKLLKAGARVCKPGSLLFLLLGPVNYQICPKGVRRIGWIAATIVPNNELRALNIFLKYE